ncbi:M20/M25/M40 family metallo-hydrolase [Proteinivorax tanatarense]|uniref:M20/M25/M40 family metallo-hydrolase n=1 Tax=Proteinivorax tanatarense TaxID=1260629 RepID=A0AAU7VPU6_9FIRM
MENDVVNLFKDLVNIDSPSFKEGELAKILTSKLEELNFKVELEEHEGTVNIIAKRNGEGEPILLSSHMDTVLSNKGVKIIEEKGQIKTDGNTILGADDKAGIAAILTGIKHAVSKNKDLISLVVVFTYGEEVGLNGAKRVEKDRIGAKYGYVFDSGGDVGIAINKAPSEIDFTAEIIGKEAHSGVNPEDGVDAIKIAGHIISALDLGKIDEETTANIGVIKGGEMTNVICPLVELKGEVRSHDFSKTKKIAQEFKEVFDKNAQKYGGKVEFKKEIAYKDFYLDKEQEVVKYLERNLRELGRKLELKSRGGGSDANVFNEKGIPTLNLAVGMTNGHTTEEFVTVENLVMASKLVEKLVEKESRSG